MLIHNIGVVKSFADDLNSERGIVSSRVALLLRSAEIKPLFHKICSIEHFPQPMGRSFFWQVHLHTDTGSI